MATWDEVYCFRSKVARGSGEGFSCQTFQETTYSCCSLLLSGHYHDGGVVCSRLLGGGFRVGRIFRKWEIRPHRSIPNIHDAGFHERLLTWLIQKLRFLSGWIAILVSRMMNPNVMNPNVMKFELTFNRARCKRHLPLPVIFSDYPQELGESSYSKSFPTLDKPRSVSRSYIPGSERFWLTMNLGCLCNSFCSIPS